MPKSRAGELLQALSSRPEHLWPDAALHHGFRVALLLGLVFLMQVLFPVVPVPNFPEVERGMVPQQDIIAEVGFTIPKSDAELAQERDDAAAAVPPVFRYDPSAEDSMLVRVRRFMTHVDSAARVADTELERQQAIRQLLTAYGFPVGADALTLLSLPGNRATLLRSLESVIRQVMPQGLVSSTDFEDSPDQHWVLIREDTERILPRDSMLSQGYLLSRAGQFLPADSPPGMFDFQRLVLIRFFDGSIRLDRARTQAARDQARQAVLTYRGEVLRGERVIAAHEPVRERELERIEAYRQHLIAVGQLGDGAARRAPVVGMFVLNLLILSIIGFLLFFYRPELYLDVRQVVLLAVLVASLAAAAAAVGRTDAPVELVPIAFPALVIAVLWDGRLALNVALVLAALLAVQAPFLTMSSRVLLLLGGSAAALSVRVVRRRAQGLILGVVVALVYAVAIIALGLLRSHEPGAVVTGIMWGAANGVASALIAMGFLPLFEAWTRITTDQTLLELTDLNRPLLKRLSLEASGTYAHSINVANLGEAAARAVNANALLVRVGAYYHDIGKMGAPQYFVENQARGRNPHDQLDPRRSAQIVRAHVTEGMKMAEQAKLPDSVKSFIPEHHGTQLIGFFYDLAREANPEAELDPADFAYGGPKPRSVETAILMMADSIESAAKAMQDPTAERIRELVDRIVEGKTAQGQLDEAPLTMRDIVRIKEQFVAVLMGMYHHRLDYPTRPTIPDREPVAPVTGA
jgi:cyclic-di-AMP phosphodiesterase PgpH